MTHRKRLVLFFYLLVRDHVPVGVVFEIIQDYVNVTNATTYTSEAIQAVAEEIVSDLGVRGPHRDESVDRLVAAADHLFKVGRDRLDVRMEVGGGDYATLHLALAGYMNARRLLSYDTGIDFLV